MTMAVDWDVKYQFKQTNINDVPISVDQIHFYIYDVGLR